MGNSSSSVKEFNPKSSLNIDKQKYFKWKYDTLVDERNQLRDTAHRFFKVYKELEEPDWSERVKVNNLCNFKRRTIANAISFEKIISRSTSFSKKYGNSRK